MKPTRGPLKICRHLLRARARPDLGEISCGARNPAPSLSKNPFLPVFWRRLSRWFICLGTLAGVNLRGGSGHGQGRRGTLQELEPEVRPYLDDEMVSRLGQ